MSPLAFAVFAVLLVWAAVGDVRAYRIPNWLCAALAVAGVALAFPGSTDVWIARGEAVAAVAAVGLVLYLANALGGGDYKLLVAVAFWMPVGELIPFTLLLALAGGVQALATLVWRRFAPAGEAPAVEAQGGRPHARAMPYGVSIAAAGILWGIVAVGMR